MPQVSKQGFLRGAQGILKRAGYAEDELGLLAEGLWLQKRAGDFAEAAAAMGPALGGRLFSQFADAGETLDQRRQEKLRQQEQLRLLAAAQKDQGRPAPFPAFRGRGHVPY